VQLIDRVLSGKIQGITDAAITHLDQRLRATL